MLAETRYEHIVLEDSRVPVISGTTMKVVELVLAHMAYGWSPEELHIQFPHLTLGQIYSALAYYWDHRKELDADIEKRLKGADRIQKGVSVPPLVSRLKNEGLIGWAFRFTWTTMFQKRSRSVCDCGAWMW
jgi:uncharacterized protein (DUF433 family)